MNSWIATIPQGVAWETYAAELAAVADGTAALNYRVARPLRDMRPGDRFYVTWRGRVRGWMTITDVVHHPDGFTCLTTGRRWSPGCYIQRSGPFHTADGPDVAGFQGVRRFAPSAARNEGAAITV